MNAVKRKFILGWLIVLTILATCSRPERRAQIPEPQPTPAVTNISANNAPGDYVEEITSAGQSRKYRLHIPTQYQPGQPLPLVINLHGFNSDAAQQEQVSKMSVKADEAGFIVVHPEALGSPQTWHFGVAAEAQMDLMFFRDLISNLESQWNINPKRIYISGMSNGAQMTNHLGCELSDIIAAIGPVSGGYPILQSCNPVRPVPVVAFHGTADNLIPYEGQGQILLPAPEWAAGWASRNGCDQTPRVTFQTGQVTGETWGNCREGADVILYTVEGGGHSWPGSDMLPQLGITTQDIDATDVIWDFFAAHTMP